MKSALLLVVPVVSLWVTPGRAEAARPLAKAELDIEMFYQFSATDEDAEVTLGIESPDHPIDSLMILAPDGRTVATVRSRDVWVSRRSSWRAPSRPWKRCSGRIRRERTGSWAGRSTAHCRRIEITHDVVGAPDFVNFSPCDQEVDPTSSVAIAWNSVAGAEGGYEIIIEQDDTGANLRVTQGPRSNQLRDSRRLSRRRARVRDRDEVRDGRR